MDNLHMEVQLNMVVDMNNERDTINEEDPDDFNDDEIHSLFDGGDEMEEIQSPIDVVISPPKLVSQIALLPPFICNLKPPNMCAANITTSTQFSPLNFMPPSQKNTTCQPAQYAVASQLKPSP